MKKITFISTLCFLILTVIIHAQTPPNAFNYSAVARNASGQPISSATIGIQIKIFKTSPTGVSQYCENHLVSTDAYGLFNLVIGAGAVQSGSINMINWGNDNYFLQIGMDTSGGTNFLTMGCTQLLSVPYALYSKNSGFSVTNDNSYFVLDNSQSDVMYKTYSITNPSDIISIGFIKIYDIANQPIQGHQITDQTSIYVDEAGAAITIKKIEIPFLTIDGWKVYTENF